MHLFRFKLIEIKYIALEISKSPIKNYATHLYCSDDGV
jgi:hypothetical protein